ncbi:VOC family protein [Iodobacter violaceini]|uniref:VOC family protein n=1 Tax=Iodobacter violaceini TaxID=3044271 RepID=UPI00197C8F5D|nr:VOC family protein [Iodobacter violacea]
MNIELKRIESILLFVADIEAAAAWYASIFGAEVQHENPQFAFIRAPGIVIGFHPADEKCPGGIGGTSAYWEVSDITHAIENLVRLGARVYRGPGETDFGAKIALLIDPFGCTIGLNQASAVSRSKTGVVLP